MIEGMFILCFYKNEKNNMYNNGYVINILYKNVK